MEIERKSVPVEGIKFYIKNCGQEIGRARLYIFYNDLHKEPLGYLEDVFIDESLRGRGIGTKLINVIKDEVRRKGCYKLVATSRHSSKKVHKLYKRLGFKDYGIEFRMDL